MNTWIRRSLQVGIVSAGLVLVGATAAQADSDLTSIGNLGIANGNQLYAPIQVPVDVCGNALGVLGNAQASCKGGSSARLHKLGDATSIGNAGILNGNQAIVPIQVPVDVCGNALGVAGNAAANCKGGSEASIGHKRTRKSAGLPDATSIGNFGIANGNQAIVPIQLPVNVCGNAAGVAGNGQASCKGGSQARIGGSKKHKGNHGKGKVRKHGSTDLTSIGNFGIANGNQLYAPIQVPIDVCGNALGVLGNAQASCKGGSRATLRGGRSDLTSIGNAGILNGNQAYLPIQVPVEVSGNALGLLGNGAASSKGGASAHIR
jgi:hypothetical protein